MSADRWLTHRIFKDHSIVEISSETAVGIQRRMDMEAKYEKMLQREQKKKIRRHANGADENAGQTVVAFAPLL